MEEPKHHQKKQRRNFAFGISFPEFLISAAVGIGSGIATASAKVHNLFHDDIRHATAYHGHFVGRTKEQWEKDVYEEYEGLCPKGTDVETWMVQHEQAIKEKLANRPIGRQERLDSISLKDYREKFPEKEAGKRYRADLRKIKGAIADDLEELNLKFRGIRKSHILGTIDKFETLSPRSVRALKVNGAAGAAIGAVMTLGFFNGVATRDAIDNITDAVDAINDNNPGHKSTRFRDKVGRASGRINESVENDTSTNVGTSR